MHQTAVSWRFFIVVDSTVSPSLITVFSLRLVISALEKAFDFYCPCLQHIPKRLCNKENEMAIYLVRLKGKNFLIDGDKGPRKKRFRSTRLVEAENQNRAETLARELISNDPRFQNSVLNEESDLPIIYVESVKEISASAYDAQNRANSLYWEDEDNK